MNYFIIIYYNKVALLFGLKGWNWLNFPQKKSTSQLKNTMKIRRLNSEERFFNYKI